MLTSVNLVDPHPPDLLAWLRVGRFTSKISEEDRCAEGQHTASPMQGQCREPRLDASGSQVRLGLSATPVDGGDIHFENHRSEPLE